MTINIEASPYSVSIDPAETAIIIIDMQRDFLEPGGFGDSLGNDVSLLQSAITPCKQILNMARTLNMLVVHTREGHRPDLSDVPAMKQARCKKGMKIGDKGKMGRILIRGEYGQDIINTLKPLSNEPVIDKPGKGAFYSTDLDLILCQANIKNLIFCGVTTEICVQTTVREANDRGYLCLVSSDACASYFPEFHLSSLQVISAQGGILGFVTDTATIVSSFK
jgi:nicotinamidase-related amidase